MAREAPPAIGRLGQEDPGAVGERWITRRIEDDRAAPARDRELLLAIESAKVREDLDPSSNEVTKGGQLSASSKNDRTASSRAVMCRRP